MDDRSPDDPGPDEPPADEHAEDEPSAGAQPTDAPPADATYRDPTAPVERRVEDLLARMTTAEKVARLGAVRADQVLEDGALDRDAAASLLDDGVGHLTRIGGEGGLDPAEAARVTNDIQRLLVEETRLGVPAIPHEECLSGYMGPRGTTFPQALGLASSWDPALVAAVTDRIRTELRAIGARHALSPVADVARDPRWGRTEETFGEDPYLVGAAVCGYVAGLQGDAAREAGPLAFVADDPAVGVDEDDAVAWTEGAATDAAIGGAADAEPGANGADADGADVDGVDADGSDADGADVNGVDPDGADAGGVAATVKHFLGHGAGAGGKNRSAVDLAPATLREVHGFPFEAAVRVAGVESVMNAYHAIDGVPCASAEWLLTDLLRGEWAFDGTVVSDYYSVANLREEHGVAASSREAAVAALRAGIDVELPATDCYETLLAAVEDGAVAEATVDAAVRRVLRATVRSGALDDPYVDPDAARSAVGGDAAAALSREAGRASTVLLRNEDDLLPLDEPGAALDAPPETVAVVGPKADSATGLLGDYAYAAHYPEQTDAFDAVTPLAAIDARVDADVVHEPGCATTGTDTDGLDAAAAAAADADVALAFVGARSAVDVSDDASAEDGAAAGATESANGDAADPEADDAVGPTVPTSGEGRDVTDLSLPGVQPELVERLAETGTPLVVVVVSGKPHSIVGAAERADAVVQAWLPGERGGDALVDVLFEGVDPGGRLPISIPRSVGQLPVHYARGPNAARERYVHDDGEPLFAFGHGESYAAFAYDDVAVSPATVEPFGTVSVAVTVTNVADRAGSEVVQLYASAESPSRTRPVQELVGFQRLALGAGASARVTFEVSATQLGYHGATERPTLGGAPRFGVEAGQYELRVARASDDVVATERVEVAASADVPTSGRTYFADVSVEPVDE